MPTKYFIKAGDGDPRHGTYNGYNNHKCRCDRCRDAERKYSGDVPMKIHLARVHAAAQFIEHGKSWSYEGKGCRCDLCRMARRERGQRQREAKRDRMIAEIAKRAKGGGDAR